MDWFWRGTNAVALGSLVGWGTYTLFWQIARAAMRPEVPDPDEPVVLASWLVSLVLTSVSTLLFYSLLGRVSPKRPRSRSR